MIVLCSLFLMLSTRPTEAGDTATWYTLLPRVAETWQRVPDEARAERLQLRPIEAWEGKRYKVMVLFPKQSSAYDVAMAQILAVFGEKKLTADFHLVLWDSEQAGLDAVKEAENEGFDLLYSMGSQSTTLIHDKAPDTRVPVVTVCSKDPVLMGQIADYTSGSGSRIAYTSLDLPMSSQMAYLKRLIPDLRQIAVLYARDNQSARITQVEPLVAACAHENIRVLEVVVEDQDRAVEELTAKVPAAAHELAASDPTFAASIFWITGSTSVFREIQTINAHTRRFPVLSVVPNVVKAGDDSAVMSIGVSFENNAQIAALYGVRIVTGQADPATLPVGVVSPPDIAVNFKKARAIGLKIPFAFFESAGFVYDHRGVLVRENGQNLNPTPD